MMAFQVAPALATGNTIVVKAAEVKIFKLKIKISASPTESPPALQSVFSLPFCFCFVNRQHH